MVTTDPPVPLDPDGLPHPTNPLTPDQQSIRRVAVEVFGTNYSAMAVAMDYSRGTVAKLCEGRQPVKHVHLQAVANAARTTIEALRVPHPQAIYAGGAWFLPDHQRYAQMALNLLAANPGLDPKGFDLPD